MVHSCCVTNCPNRTKKGQTIAQGGLHFYPIPCKKTPFEERRREDWIRALKRDDWKNWEYDRISKQRVCSAHFISGARSDDPNDPDWAPTVFEHNAAAAIKKGIQQRQRQKRHETIQEKRFPIPVAPPPPMETTITEPMASTSYIPIIGEHNYVPSFPSLSIDEATKECAVQVDDLSAEFTKLTKQFNDLSITHDKLKITNEKLIKQSKLLRFKTVNNNNDIKFYTGLPTVEVFSWVVAMVRPHVFLTIKSLTLYDQILLVLMKLRLGSLHQDIANQFGVSESTVSVIFRQVLPVMSKVLRSLIIWPTRDIIRHNLPHCFHKNYRDAVCIIDCSEIYIERPTNLTARAQTWSNYKHNNTVKYLIGITPAGAMMFLSVGWGGRTSDKEITNESGFLDKISHGDCILADRGFLIEEELNERGATLSIPSFLKGGVLTKGQTHTSGNLSSVRIHVERVIGRMKKYRIISSIIPISIVDLLDDIMVVISACVNLNKSVVPKKSKQRRS